MKLVRDTMSTKVVTVVDTTSLNEVVELLDLKGYGGLPVVDAEQNLVGLVSRTDITTYLLQEKADRTVSISVLMTPFLFSIKPEDSLKSAIEVMLKAEIHRIVVTEEGKPVGIITSMDLVREYVKSL